MLTGKLSVVGAVVVVCRCGGRRSGLRRLGRRVSPNLFRKFLECGVPQRRRMGKAVSGRRGRGRESVSWSSFWSSSSCSSCLGKVVFENFSIVAPLREGFEKEWSSRSRVAVSGRRGRGRLSLSWSSS